MAAVCLRHSKTPLTARCARMVFRNLRHHPRRPTAAATTTPFNNFCRRSLALLAFHCLFTVRRDI